MFPRIRWFVLGTTLAVVACLFIDPAIAKPGRGGRGGGSKASRGGGASRSSGRSGASRSSGSRGGGRRSAGRSGGSRSFGGRSGGGRSSGRSGGSRSIGGRSSGGRSIGRSGPQRSIRSGGSSRRSIGGSGRSSRSSGNRGIIRRSAPSVSQPKRSRNSGGSRVRSAPRVSQPRGGQQNFRAQKPSDRSRDRGRRIGRGGDRKAFAIDRDRRGRADRGDRFRRGGFGRDDHHDGDHDRFRRRGGRFFGSYGYPYRSFGIYLGRPYSRNYGFSLGFGGGYDPYYFDYRYDYYLDSYLSLDCYHFGYDPACVYPAPPGYAAVVPDESVPFDDELQLTGDELLALGEEAFFARDYPQAVRWLRHAAIELPDNPKVLMLLSQGLFAVGDYNEAAGAVQAGMLVAEDAKQWGEIIGDYRRYYSNSQDYVDQLKALEKNVFEKAPDDRAARFLIAIQYGLLGYPKQAVRELDILLKSAPEDRLAREFRRRMAEQLGLIEPAPLPAGPVPPSVPEQETKGPSLPPLPETPSTPQQDSTLPSDAGANDPSRP